MKWILIVMVFQHTIHAGSGTGFSAEYNTATACLAAKEIVTDSYPRAFAHCTQKGE